MYPNLYCFSVTIFLSFQLYPFSNGYYWITSNRLPPRAVNFYFHFLGSSKCLEDYIFADVLHCKGDSKHTVSESNHYKNRKNASWGEVSHLKYSHGFSKRKKKNLDIFLSLGSSGVNAFTSGWIGTWVQSYFISYCRLKIQLRLSKWRYVIGLYHHLWPSFHACASDLSIFSSVTLGNPNSMNVGLAFCL